MDTFDLKRAISSAGLAFGHRRRVPVGTALSNDDMILVLRR